MISFLEVFLSYTLIPYIFGGCKRSLYVNCRNNIKIRHANMKKRDACVSFKRIEINSQYDPGLDDQIESP